MTPKFDNLVNTAVTKEKKISAGVLLYNNDEGLKVFLVKAGGPFLSKKDHWSIPKGHIEEGEEAKEAAIREFQEETGITISDETAVTFLTQFEQNKFKTVVVFILKGSGVEEFKGSNYFEIEWPPRSGKTKKFEENIGGKYFPIVEAKEKIIASQLIVLQQLEEKLNEV